MGDPLINVEVAYATPEQQIIVNLEVATDATAEQAILASGILKQFPEIELAQTKIGIFGKVCKLDNVLFTGDRVEIYRPLLIGPKEHRRQRAAKGKKINVDAED